MTKTRWGLLSTANINRHVIPALRASPRGELVAVASRSQATADAYARRWEIPQAFASYQAMLDSGAVDAVYISLPNLYHAEWTIRSLQAGLAVLCEKPFALSLDEVDSVAAAAQASGRPVAEAFMYRHHPQMKLALEWAKSGRLGEVTLVRSTFNFKIDQRTDIRLQPSLGGGSLWDVGVYPISFAQAVLGGPPEEVLGDQWIGDTGVDEGFSGQMCYSGNRVAQISCSFRTPFYTSAEILGTEGRLVLDSPFVPGRDGKPHHVTFYPAGDAPREMPFDELYLYQGEVEDLQDALLHGTPPFISLAETRNHIRTALALYESARTGVVVPL
ncbi:MAG: Gfo/Idh/MocA family oxidoreductase [Methylotetracoccus sp.]|nr:Gfo/Idh/MocA family oxidoreductase [Methylotetracoccus sp.]